MSAGTIAVIGDVHGNVAALDGALALIGETCSATVLVGDYVNRGSDSRAVLDRLVEVKAARDDVHFVRGNHDAAFYACLEHGHLREFLVVGGAATIRSYVQEPSSDVLAQLRDAVPIEHVEFLKSLVNQYSCGDLLVVHDMDAARDPLRPGQFAVAGHTVQHPPLPNVSPTQALIDTGCGTLPDAPLCCFFWPSRDWVLINATGEVVRSS